MSRRNTQFRRRAIIEILKEKEEVSVDELARKFETSEVTIRKDLADLESNGLLLRRYGGAVPLPKEFVGDSAQLSESKGKIAKAAADLIRDHYRIIVDSGSTTAAMLPLLQTKRGLVVMTNSLNIVTALRELENEPTILMTGGTWDGRSESFQGQLAEVVLKHYDFDQLFIGADGIDVARGTTTYNELYNLSRVMSEVSREVIVMAESSKIQRKIFNVELGWEGVDVFVTDSGIKPEEKKQIEDQGVKVICAE